MTETRTYSRSMHSQNRLNMNTIPHFLLRSAYSTCRCSARWTSHSHPPIHTLLFTPRQFTGAAQRGKKSIHTRPSTPSYSHLVHSQLLNAVNIPFTPSHAHPHVHTSSLHSCCSTRWTFTPSHWYPHSHTSSIHICSTRWTSHSHPLIHTLLFTLRPFTGADKRGGHPTPFIPARFVKCGAWFCVWSFVVLFLSCVVLLLLCVCVCDLFLFLHPPVPTLNTRSKGSKGK